jgi:hypothetical protein
MISPTGKKVSLYQCLSISHLDWIMYELSRLGRDLPAKPHVKGHFSEMSIFYYNRPGDSRQPAADSKNTQKGCPLIAACCKLN